MSTVTSTWTSGKQFVVETDRGHAIVVDAPAAVGGRESGMSPMELLLGGLGGCTGVDVVYLLSDKMRKKLTGVSVEFTGHRREQVPKIYDRIEVHYRVRGSKLAEKDVVRALRLSEQKLCSASAMLAESADISGRYTIEDVHGGDPITGER